MLIHGRLDLGGPLLYPWTIAQTWGELVVVERDGHGGPGTTAEIEAALERFA